MRWLISYLIILTYAYCHLRRDTEDYLHMLVYRTCEILHIGKVSMMSHREQERHTCSTCRKSFSQLSHLKVRLLNHTGDTPHSCELCGKSFKDKGHLKIMFTFTLNLTSVKLVQNHFHDQVI